MPAPASFDFATIRVVPRVERQEFLNAGIIVFSLERKFLQAMVHFDEVRLRAMWPELDLTTVRDHLEAIPKVCAGAPDAGPIAALTIRERFHWLVAPRSTVIQMSPVHTGLSDFPEAELAKLFGQLVATPPPSHAKIRTELK